MHIEELLTKKFIITFFIVFVVLYIFCTFIRFLGQLPILLIITFFITYYLNKKNMSTENNYSI